MACALFDPVGADGEDLLAAEPVAEVVSISARTSKSGKSKASDKPKGRSKKNEVVMLSTSFTCWRKVPESRLESVIYQIQALVG